MSEMTSGQVNRSAAEIYAEFFIPALFAEWPEKVLHAAGARPGDAILDVACGTGVLTRAAARRVGPDGQVVGLDINEGMLAVARRSEPAVDWRQGRAEDLPFPDGSFDRIVSQFGLMFFENRVKAVQEMLRVRKPGGKLAVAVWDKLENTPGYAAVTGLLRRQFGDEVAGGMQAPYVLGDRNILAGIFRDAGAGSAEIRTLSGTARFPSIDDWMYTDIRGWTLSDAVDDAQFEALKAAARRELAQFVQPDGSVAFAAPAHIVVV